jgi:hypothetical protein
MLTDGWLAEIPYIVGRLPPDEHLPFLVQLFRALEDAGVRLDEHLDCALLALCEEGDPCGKI